MGVGGRWGGRLFEVGANSRLGAYSNKYGMWEPTSFPGFSPTRPTERESKNTIYYIQSGGSCSVNYY